MFTQEASDRCLCQLSLVLVMVCTVELSETAVLCLCSRCSGSTMIISTFVMRFGICFILGTYKDILQRVVQHVVTVK